MNEYLVELRQLESRIDRVGYEIKKYNELAALSDAQAEYVSVIKRQLKGMTAYSKALKERIEILSEGEV